MSESIMTSIHWFITNSAFDASFLSRNIVPFNSSQVSQQVRNAMFNQPIKTSQHSFQHKVAVADESSSASTEIQMNRYLLTLCCSSGSGKVKVRSHLRPERLAFASHFVKFVFYPLLYVCQFLYEMHWRQSLSLSTLFVLRFDWVHLWHEYTSMCNRQREIW